MMATPRTKAKATPKARISTPTHAKTRPAGGRQAR